MSSDRFVHLGDEVKDKVSGFSGVVTSITEYLNGCRRIGIQPPVKADDGKLPDAFLIDEVQLEVIKKEKFSKGSEKKGGPNICVKAQKAQ